MRIIMGISCFLAGMAALNAGAVRAGEGLAVAVPSDTASGWSVWPAGKIAVAAVEGPALHFDQSRNTGHFSRDLARKDGARFAALSFRARTRPDAPVKWLEVMVAEKDGELFYKRIDLAPEWRTFRLAAADLRHYPHGNAKVVDGRLDTAGVVRFRLNGYPAGRDYFLADLRFEYDAPSAEPAPAEMASRPSAVDRFDIKPIAWDPAPPPRYHDAFPGLQDIGIQGNAFTRDGRRTFLLGGWQTDVGGPPWLMRALGVDVMIYNAAEIYTLYPPKRLPDGTLEASWSENPWYEAVIRRFLSSGVRFWHEHKGHPKYNELRKHEEFREVYKAGHFVPYDPFHPRGREMYMEMFKSWMRYTRKYPVFCYELFNEMIYDNPHVISRRAFRERMKGKFGTIADANRAWGTNFTSFDRVNPPGYLRDDGQNDALPRERLILDENRAFPNLMIDWEKFQQDRCHEAVAALMPAMRALDPDPKVFSTIQSHLNLYFDIARIGIKPETLVDFSDFYSHEAGFNYPETDGYRNFTYLSNLLKSFFFADAVRGFCPDKPIFNAEAPLGVTARGAEPGDLEASDLAALASTPWRFRDATAAEPEGWTAPGHPDADWPTIKVPSMWGSEGFPQCQVGLYRKRFKLARPAKGRLYLNGQGFADEAEIYLNGERIGAAKGYNAAFAFDVTDRIADDNVLAVRVVNRYFQDGMYYGGIRGFVSLNTATQLPARSAGVEPRHLRSFFWSQLLRGTSGVMLCYEGNFLRPSARHLPEIKAELENLADLVLDPAAQPPARVAVVYPLESLRAVTHKDYMETLSSPATSGLMPFYASALFARAPGGVDVLRNKDLMGAKSPAYALVMLPADVRVPAGLLEKLETYVRNGGHVLVDVGGLSVDDDTHAPLDASRLTGVRAGRLEKGPAAFRQTPAGAGSVRLRFQDGVTRARLEPAGAEVLFKYEDGVPLLTEHVLGKGKVFYLNGSFAGPAAKQWADYVMQRSGVTAEVLLAPLDGAPPPEAVESRLLAGKDGRRLLFLQNLDPGGAATASLASLPAGRYRLRNAATGSVIPSPAGASHWDADTLTRGWPVRLGQYDPVVVLLEPEGVEPLPLRGISPVRKTMMESLWAKLPAGGGRPKVAIAAHHGDVARQTFATLPTLYRLLSDQGYEVVNHNDGDPLDGVSVLILPHLRLKAAHHERILEYVRGGGALLLFGNAKLNYHMTNNNAPLLSALGLGEAAMRSGVLYARPEPPPPGDNLRVECVDFADHPTRRNVDRFVSSCASWLTKLPPGAQVLLRAPEGSSAPGQPLAALFPHGEGQAAWVGDYWFLWPEEFERGDNAQWVLNLVNHLAKRPLAALSPEVRDGSLYITSARLRQAEAEEKSGNPPMAPLRPSDTYLPNDNSMSWRGTAGGDPIVDMMRR